MKDTATKSATSQICKTLGAIIKTKPKEYEIEYENENNCNTGNHNFDEFNSNFWTRTYHRGRNI